MSSYHSSFTYLNKNSYEDFKWHIVHIDNSDKGETDSFLGTESIGTSLYDGTRNLLYGTKYSETATLQITIIKGNGGDFTLEETRAALRWLTGSKQNSWLDLYIGDEVKYRMLGHMQNAKPYKMDARVVGLVLTFESAAPYAFSPLQTITQSINGTDTISIYNETDDIYNYTYLKTIYQNTTGQELIIENVTTGETTEVNNLSANEIVTIDNNQMITSDNSARTFGKDFNFIFPRLVAEENSLMITGTGEITFEYIYPIKVADAIGELNAVSDPICDGNGELIVDKLDWSRVSNTPSTLAGYGIKDAYTKSEIDTLLENFTPGDTYTKTEIDEMFANIDVSGIDTYTKAEIDEKLANITSSGVDINEEELDAMLAEVLV